jgi:hypothetical protein
MESEGSNVRPISILGGYLLTAALLTWRATSIIASQRARKSTIPARLRRKSLVFSLLAVISLATTWYYMFSFFAHSYSQWALARAIPVQLNSLHLGPWLRDTSLFKQAWGTAMETDARFWWTQQIFGFCSAWSIILGGKRTYQFQRHRHIHTKG